MINEMRMIRWMCDFTRLDRVRNAVIKERVEIAPLEEKMRSLDQDGLGMLRGGV